MADSQWIEEPVAPSEWVEEPIVGQPPPPPSDNILGEEDLIPLTGESPETTEGKGLLGSLLNFALEMSPIPPMGRGDMPRPVVSQEDVNIAKDLLGKGAGTALEIGGSLVAPEAQVARGMSLIPRIARMGEAAAQSALGAAGGRQVSQALGLTPRTSLQEEINTIGQDVALGGGIPAVTDVVTTGTSKLGRMFSPPARVAKFFGASAADLNEEGSKILDTNIQELMQVSPDFEKRVAGNLSIQGAYKQAKALRDNAGREISEFYRNGTGQSRKAFVVDLVNHENYQKWVDELSDQSRLPATDKRVIRNVIRDFESTLKGATDEISAEDLWKLRKSFDEKLVKQFYEKATPDATLRNRVYKDLADIYRDNLDSLAPELREANNLYHLLVPVTDILGKSAAQTKGKIPFLDKSLSLSQIGKMSGVIGAGYFGGPLALGAGATALAATTNPGRAGLLNSAFFAEGIRDTVSTIPPSVFSVVPRSVSSIGLLLNNSALPEEEKAILQDASTKNTAIQREVLNQVATKHPELFEPSPLPGYNVVDGRINDPFQRFSYSEELRERERAEGKSYTEHLHQLNLDGTVLELKENALTQGTTVSLKSPGESATLEQTNSKALGDAERQVPNY